MKRFFSTKLLSMLLCSAIVFNACKKDEPTDEPTVEVPSGYSLAVNVGGVNYVLQTEDLFEGGNVSPVGNGVEIPGNELIQSGNYFYFFSRAEKKFYQYELNNDGTVEQVASILLTSYISDRAYSQNLIDDKTILIIDPVTWGEPSVKWVRISIPDFVIAASGTAELPTFKNDAGENWKVNVGKAVLHGSKIIMGSVYYDYAGNYAEGTHAITFDYPSMTNPATITSPKSTGEIGYTNQLFAKTSNGDLYVGVYRGTYGAPSTDDVKGYILRVKSGATTFDNDYFFDLSATIGEPTQVMQLNFLEGSSAMAMLFNTNDMPAWANLDDDMYYYAKVDLAAKTVSKFNAPKASVRQVRYPLISNGKYITYQKSKTANTAKILEIDYNGGADAYKLGKLIEGDGVNPISVVKHPAK